MKRNIILCIGLLFSILLAQAQEEGLSIGKKSIDASAILEVTAPSNDKGVLLPRLTSFQRESIGAPAEGLLIFDTDLDEFYYFDGNNWISLGHAKYRKGSNAIDEEHLTIMVGNAKNVGITNRLAVGDEDFVQEVVSENSVAVQGEISANDDISTEGKFVGNGTIPLGGIIMWSGATPPQGWVICNGQSFLGFKTPDLRGRFIVGFDPGNTDYDNPGNLSSSGYDVGKTGGLSSVTLSVNQMPTHFHQYGHDHSYPDMARKMKAYEFNTYPGSFGGIETENVIYGIDTYQLENGPVRPDSEIYNQWGLEFNTHFPDREMETEGGDQPHENRPPYYVLAFIMRVR